MVRCRFARRGCSGSRLVADLHGRHHGRVQDTRGDQEVEDGLPLAVRVDDQQVDPLHAVRPLGVRRQHALAAHLVRVRARVRVMASWSGSGSAFVLGLGP